MPLIRTAVLVLLGLCIITEAKPYKRSPIKREVQPQLAVSTQYYIYQDPSSGQTYYYTIGADGKAYYVQGGQSQPTQQVVQESSGGLLSWLGKPLNAVGNIVGKTGDVVSGIIDLPFSAARQVVSGVGLDQTGVGRLATGVLNAGQAIVDTPVSLVLDVAELPFRAVADAVQDKE